MNEELERMRMKLLVACLKTLLAFAWRKWRKLRKTQSR